METKVFRSRAELPQVTEILREGGLAAVPTETVYGLCANALDAGAVEKIYAVKGRPENKPLSVMISGAEEMGRYCRDVPPAARALAAKYWPGPLTIILPAGECIPGVVLAGGDTVGLRCPNHPLTLALLEQSGLPLAGPSANPSGAEPPRSAEAVLGYFGGKIGAVLDGGACALGEPSTLLDMSSEPYRILRQGSLGRESIEETLRKNMTVVGLTGGSGVGKTSALRELERRGALILDCDEIYHELTVSSPEMKAALEARFGAVYRDGVLDRKALGSVVFQDAAALEALNAITHRFVLEEVDRRLRRHAMAGGRLGAIDAVALLESGLGELCTFTVAVTAEEEVRVRRIMARDGISEDYARSRIRAQKSPAYFAEHCDYVLENNGSREEFDRRCREFFAQTIQE